MAINILSLFSEGMPEDNLINAYYASLRWYYRIPCCKQTNAGARARLTHLRSLVRNGCKRVHKANARHIPEQFVNLPFRRKKHAMKTKEEKRTSLNFIINRYGRDVTVPFYRSTDTNDTIKLC